MLAEKVDWKLEQWVFSALYQVELDEDIIIGLLTLPRNEWENDKYRDHPIHDIVEAEGVLVA